MNAAGYADAVIQAVSGQRGEELAFLFTLNALHHRPVQYPCDLVIAQLRDPKPQRIQSALVKCRGFLGPPWTEILTHQLVIAQRLASLPAINLRKMTMPIPPRGFGYDTILDDSGRTIRDAINEAWEAINALVTNFLRYFSSLHPGRWCLPLLYTILSNYRKIAVLADNVPLSTSMSKQQQSKKGNLHLEECARQLNKAFSACVSDRTTEEEESRKWGTYEVVGNIFRGYFRLKSLPLCRNILRALTAADLPAFERFPRAQRVTFQYYTGVLAFLGEEYSKAEVNLRQAFSDCHGLATHNQQMILQYLIPCRMLTGTLPTQSLLARFPLLNTLYTPFLSAIRRGDVRAYDTALATPALEKALVKNGTYLAIERAREICMRGLLKRVYRTRDGKSRIAIEDFHRALQFVGVQVDLLETEWLVATQIAKGYMRGYISHSHMMTVLSAQNPFPKLGSVGVVI